MLFVEIHRLYPTPPPFGAPVGGDPCEFRRDFWHQKTRVPGLSYGVVCVFLCFAILVEHRLVTDRQTHRQTHRQTDTRHGIYRESIARAVKSDRHRPAIIHPRTLGAERSESKRKRVTRSSPGTYCQGQRSGQRQILANVRSPVLVRF